MLGTSRVHLALALSTAAALMMGCGGDPKEGTGGSGGSPTTTTSSSGGTGGTGGSTSSSGGTGATGGGLTCDNGEGVVLSVSELMLGEGSNGQWKKVGMNIDGLESTANSKDVCQPNSGGDPNTTYPDGDGGIDNSFGKNLLPILLSLYPEWPADINNGILNGVFTSLLKLECLPPEGDVASFNTKLFGGTDLPDPPKFDGTDAWPVTPELLSNPEDPLSSTVEFPFSSVKDNVFDSGKNQTFILTIPLKTANNSTSIKLTLYAARTTMTLAADRKSANQGTIAGVLDTEELISEIKKVGFLMNLCDTSLFNGILDTIRQSSDIMVDGTQDSTQVCNGISLGLNFNMKEAMIGPVAPVSPPGEACN